METKSRYEIIAELEAKKNILISQEANIRLNENAKRKAVLVAQEDLDAFLSEKDIVAENIKDQLASIEKSLERLNSQKTK